MYGLKQKVIHESHRIATEEFLALLEDHLLNDALFFFFF